ncbi:Mediator of RNA polymerase II transcription subunit 27, variant 3 [Basidiobolus ranarum]|uniref:Mediator of RNA polymerase II transcription subunit 27, variant 3 n=1 Tax=Basidiobolus ranarum TaxID=34480 RepID=A0ABR2X3E7_9FUNG
MSEKNPSSRLELLEEMTETLLELRATVSHVFTNLTTLNVDDKADNVIENFKQNAQHSFHLIEKLSTMQPGVEEMYNHFETIGISRLLQQRSQKVIEEAEVNGELQENLIEKYAVISTQGKRAHSTFLDELKKNFRGLDKNEDIHRLKKQKSETKRSIQSVIDTWTEKAKTFPFKVLVTVLEQSQSSTVGFTVTVSNIMNVKLVVKPGATTNEVQRIVMFGIDEKKNAWEDSSYLVFQRISQLAIGAVDYINRTKGEDSLEYLLVCSGLTSL